MTSPDRLLSAIRAALDDTERAAAAADPGPWEVGPTFGARDSRVYVREVGRFDWVGAVFAAQVSNKDRPRENAAHIAAHDPAAVLRTVEADRRVLARHLPEMGIQHAYYCRRCHVPVGDPPWPCEEIRDLADRLGIDPEETPVNLLCLFGVHSRIHVPEPGPWRSDLYRCRRCPGQWRIGSHGYWWGSVHYKERIADREETR